MPRIPFQLAGGSVPGDLPGGHASPGVWAGPGAALQQFGQEIERSSEKLEMAERRVQASRDRVFASQLLSALDIEMESLREKTDTGVSGALAQQRFVESAQNFVKEHIGGTTDEALKSAIEAAANEKIAHGSILTRRYVNARIIEQTQAQGLEQVRALGERGTPEALKEGADLIRGLTEAGVFTAERGAVEYESIRKDAIANAFARDIKAGLTNTFERVNQRKGIYGQATDVEQERLMGAVRQELDRQEAKARQDLADQEKADKRREQEVHRESEDARLEATQLAMNGQYTVDALDRESKAYRWTPEQYQHIRDILTKPGKRESDPDTLEDAMLRARSIRVSQRDRDWFATQYRARKLTPDDYAKVDNEAQTNIRQSTDEAKSDIARSHAQAEQELRAGLGITGLLETLTQDQKKAYSAALQELTERSAYLKGKENPLAVVRDIIPRYQQVIADNTRLTVEQKTKALRYKTPQELEAARSTMSPEAYRINRQGLLDIGAYIPPFLRANEPEQTSTPSKPGLKREKK